MLLAAMLLSAAPDVGAEVPLMAASTQRSMHEFSECFIAAQDRQARPWWMVPSRADGGRISNVGAEGIANPYRIRFTEDGRTNAVEVFIARRDAGEEQILLEAVRSCA